MQQPIYQQPGYPTMQQPVGYPQQQFMYQPPVYPQQYPVANNGFTVPTGTGYSAGMANQGPSVVMNPQPPMTFAQTLSPAEIDQIKTKNFAYDFSIDPISCLKAKCVHKTPDGKDFSISVNDQTGEAVCHQCGAKFNMTPHDDDTVDAAFNVMNDLFQQTKLFWLNAPAEALGHWTQYEVLLQKLRGFHKLACNEYNKLLNRGVGMNYMPEQRGFQVLDQIGGNPYGAPMYGMNVPMYGQQPYGAPVYGQQQQMYGMPVAPQAPQAPVGVPTGAPEVPQPNIFGNQYQQQASTNYYGGNPYGAPAMPMPAAPQVPTGAPTAPVEEVTIKGV